MESALSTLGAEALMLTVVSWLRLAIEALGVLVIAAGVGVAVYQFLRDLAQRRTVSFNSIRLTLAMYLTLALEFQLGADLLGTAISPSWDQLGKLAVVAVIRTGLNYFLTKEMESERESMRSES